MLDGCTQLLKIFSSETTWSFEAKLWWNGPWVIPFQNCVRQSRPDKILKGDYQRIILAKFESMIGPVV
jgi:hypothetical protein